LCSPLISAARSCFFLRLVCTRDNRGRGWAISAQP
jgi:hypothetical protein